jgi:hypothetical protein
MKRTINKNLVFVGESSRRSTHTTVAIHHSQFGGCAPMENLDDSPDACSGENGLKRDRIDRPRYGMKNFCPTALMIDSVIVFI